MRKWELAVTLVVIVGVSVFLAWGFLSFLRNWNSEFISGKGLDAPMRILFIDESYHPAESSVHFVYEDCVYRVTLGEKWVKLTENPTLIQFEWDMGRTDLRSMYYSDKRLLFEESMYIILK